MTRLIAAVLILAMFVPPAAPVCKVRYDNNRRPYCQCYRQGRWEPATKFECWLWSAK